MKPSLPEGFTISEISHEQLMDMFKQWGKIIFSDNDTSADFNLFLTEQEKSNLRNLNKNLDPMVYFKLGVFHGDKMVGWFVGDQHSADRFYMRNSAILPEYRRKGLYTALMYEAMDKIKELGFQVIYSRHVTTNNAIIIPKLKAGFVISAMELSDKFGVLVHLTYNFNEMRKNILEFRAGDLKPDQKMKEVLGIL